MDEPVLTVINKKPLIFYVDNDIGTRYSDWLSSCV